ncbi:MAG TPA: thioredoxin domain-containing protein [Terriglobales bacterium]|jgi:protein-disulfide isomerase
MSPELESRIQRQVRSYYNLPPSVKIAVGAPHGSEFKNYNELTVTLDAGDQDKKEYTFLVSKDGKTLVRFTRMDLTQDPYAAVMKKIDLAGRPTRGNKDAKVVAVNYDDFQCPFCSRMHQTLFPELLKEYGDRVVFIYKDYPLSEIHPWATHAAVDANCLAAQNTDAYWEFADFVHSSQREFNAQKGLGAQFAALDRLTLQEGQKHGLNVAPLQACVQAQNEEAIKASKREAENIGVDSTPAMFVNGQKIDGALPIGEIRAILDSALQQAGVPAPAHPASAPPNPPSGK